MHLVVGLISFAFLVLMLAEFVSVFLLPRRVKRDPRIARGVLRTLWAPWRSAAARLSRAPADTMLGLFGPLGLIAILVMLSAGVVLAYSGLQWAYSTHLGGARPTDFGNALYFSAGAFFSASTPFTPTGGFSKAMQVAEAATGFGFLAIAIGYLPALFQAFSRRETAVSRLDPRAGSPPTAMALLERSGQRGGWPELDEYFREWETWTAELMETHLSYPILGYFRSQHLNQNWLAALTTIVDVSAYALAYGPEEEVGAAELTFRIGRHALADLSLTLATRSTWRNSDLLSRQRLSDEGLSELWSRLEGSGLHVEATEKSAERLQKLRSSYERYAIAISRQLALELPDWIPAGETKEYWRVAAKRHPRERVLL